jgi:hypothetical protein
MGFSSNEREKVKPDGWGDKLYNFIRKCAQNPAMTLQTLQNLAVPNIYKYNQKIAMLSTKFKEEKDPRLIVLAVIIKPYMHALEGFHPLNYSP